jgi:predicted dehydrogenase
MLRVALFGAGRWGPILLRALTAEPSCEVRRVVDADPARLKAIAPSCPRARLATDATFAAPDVDAPVIATPSATHVPLSRRALASGRHVLVEEPVATSLADALVLDELARKKGLTLMVGHVSLFHPAARAVEAELASGRLGGVQALRFERTNPGPVRDGTRAANVVRVREALSRSMTGGGAEELE